MKFSQIRVNIGLCWGKKSLKYFLEKLYPESGSRKVLITEGLIGRKKGFRFDVSDVPDQHFSISIFQ